MARRSKSDKMLLVSLLGISITNFSKGLYNSTETSYNSPFMIFPYFNREMSNVTEFELFEETLEMDGIVTAKIDCMESVTICSKLKLVPGKVYTSYPPHTKSPIGSKRPITRESLHNLAADLISDNINSEITKYGEIVEIAQERSLFLLVARSNAGDLEVKLPIFQELARSLIHKDIAFGFVTEQMLYETFGIHPLTCFVYVPPNMKHVTFQGDFTIENLKRFVKKNQHMPFSSVWPKQGMAIGLFYKELSTELRTVMEGLTSSVNIMYVNRTAKPRFADFACGIGKECAAVMDLTDKRMILLPAEFTTETVENAIESFSEFWKMTSPTMKLSAKIRMSFEIKPILMETYVISGMAVALVFIIFIVQSFIRSM